MDRKAQDQSVHIAGRIRDLSSRTEQGDFLTHTNFLSASELSECRKLMKAGLAGGTAWCEYGGYPEAERAVICFLPSWMNDPEEAEDDIICCIRIRPLNARFSDHPGHRDYLGALMNLGIERDQLGDILIQKDRDEAFVFALPGIS